MIKIQSFASLKGDEKTMASRKKSHVPDSPGEGSPKPQASGLLPIRSLHKEGMATPDNKASRGQGNHPGRLPTGVDVENLPDFKGSGRQVGHLLPPGQGKPKIPLAVGGDQGKDVPHRTPAIRSIGHRIQVVDDMDGPSRKIKIPGGRSNDLPRIEPHRHADGRPRRNRKDPEAPTCVKRDQEPPSPGIDSQVLRVRDPFEAKGLLPILRIDAKERAGRLGENKEQRTIPSAGQCEAPMGVRSDKEGSRKISGLRRMGA
jgi:hypothetical protein